MLLKIKASEKCYIKKLVYRINKGIRECFKKKQEITVVICITLL